jgi:hypothetical protein
MMSFVDPCENLPQSRSCFSNCRWCPVPLSMVIVQRSPNDMVVSFSMVQRRRGSRYTAQAAKRWGTSCEAWVPIPQVRGPEGARDEPRHERLSEPSV